MKSRCAVLTDFQWDLIAPRMPDSAGKSGGPFKDHKLVVGGIIYRYRAEIPWRDLTECFGSLEYLVKAPPALCRRRHLGRSW